MADLTQLANVIQELHCCSFTW